MGNDAAGLSIVLVDDDNAFVQDMRQSLERFFSKRNEPWTFVAFPDSESFWGKLETLRPDIVLIDILLPGENGIEMAKKLFELEHCPLLVFISSSRDFALHGYGVNALKYVLKPVTDEALAQLVGECRNRLAMQHTETLTVKGREGTRLVPMADITHLESSNRHIIIHCRNEEMTCIGRLADYMTELPHCFLQVHKSFIVNLNRVVWVRPIEITLDNGDKVPVSRRYRKLAHARFFGELAQEADMQCQIC